MIIDDNYDNDDGLQEMESVAVSTRQERNSILQVIYNIIIIIEIQVADGQFLRDGSDHLHPDSWLGLQSLLSPLQTLQRSDDIFDIG